jgi:hypothetical protein
MKKHMRLSVHGGYKPGVAGTEIWNFNLRQALVFGSVDDVGLFPDNWEVGANFSTHTEADWTTETTWTGDGPLTASFDPESYLTDYVGPTLQAYAAAGGFSSRTTWLGANLYPCDTTGKAIGGNYSRLTFTTELDGGQSGVHLRQNCLHLDAAGEVSTAQPGTRILWQKSRGSMGQGMQ